MRNAQFQLRADVLTQSYAASTLIGDGVTSRNRILKVAKRGLGRFGSLYSREEFAPADANRYLTVE